MANDVTKTGEITTVDNYNKFPEEYISGDDELELRKKFKLFRFGIRGPANIRTVSYTHLRAHETRH